jgi:hypothetical protein
MSIRSSISVEAMQPGDEISPSSDMKDVADTATEIGDSNGKKEQKSDDNVESSSTGSHGGKGGGGGSGGGYSADCSSSDASSLEAAKGSIPDKEMARLNVNVDGNATQESAAKESKASKGPKSSAQKKKNGPTRGNNQAETCGTSAMKTDELSYEADSQWNLAGDAMHDESSLPQWNGVRLRHPMDPRIDISTVGHIQTSALSAFPSDDADLPASSEQEDKESEDQSSDNPNPPSIDNRPSLDQSIPPSIDQYMRLMEVRMNHRNSVCSA